MNLSREWDVLRATKGVSWVSIAKKLNCNRKTIYGMVNSNNPTISTIMSLASAFDVTCASVIGSAITNTGKQGRERAVKINKMISLLSDSDTPCVYHLINDMGKVFYVGQSTRLKSRLSSHVYKNEFFDFSFREVTGNLDDEEMIDIIKYDPHLNRQLKSTPSTPSIRDLKDNLKSVIDSIDYFPDVYRVRTGSDRYSRRGAGIMTRERHDSIVASVHDSIVNTIKEKIEDEQ